VDSDVTVIVTDVEYDKATREFTEAASDGIVCTRAGRTEDELVAAIGGHGARHVIVGIERYSGPLYDVLEAGAVIARFGTGYDGLDLSLATRRGLLCTNTPDVLEDSVAEHAMALILSAARRVPELHAELLAGEWAPKAGMELAGKRLAVIGCGSIGRRVARIASRGFGMEVIGCDIRELDVTAMKREYGIGKITADFTGAVARADFVSLHIFSVAATAHFLNAERLAQIPRQAWVINTSRGAVIDEVALYDAAAGGHIAGAALDVFEAEPYQPREDGKDLRRLPNVVLTPHVASNTRDACSRMARAALRNIMLAERGDLEHMDLLNPEARGEE